MVNVIGKVIQLKIRESRKQKFDYLSNMNMGRSNERMRSSVLLQLYTMVRSIYISILVWMRSMPLRCTSNSPLATLWFTYWNALREYKLDSFQMKLNQKICPNCSGAFSPGDWNYSEGKTQYRHQGLRTNFLFYRYTLIGPQSLPEQSQSPWSSAVES